METNFIKFANNNFPDKWLRFFHSGTEWMMAYDIMKKEQAGDGGINFVWLPYVYPYMLGLTIELFVKSIAAYEDQFFDSFRYGHNTTKIIFNYSNRIAIFDKIKKDNKLFNLIKKFENTINTKFGDTSVSINRSDEKLVSNCAFEIRQEMCKRTGLR